MRRWISLLALFAFAGGAWAQEPAAQTASERYGACQAAANGGDRRIDEICDLVDDLNGQLRSYDGARHPRRFADLQQALGTALLVIGDLGDERALRDSISAEEFAARHYSRERAPSRWAGIQLNIAGALVTLGDMEDPTAPQEAVPLLLAAIDAIRSNEQPVLWASLQSTLATAYVQTSDNGRDADALRNAIGALQAALQVYRRPSFTEERARTQARLEELLSALGGRQDRS
ncbi:MAG: hypothetical protein R3C25_14550 [Hyphomonadaceae bacterium]